MFLDPKASHLLITTTLGENFYLHQNSKRPRQLSRLKGVHIECVAWPPNTLSSSTREILVGAQDGSVYETYIDSLEDNFIRRGEKYLKLVYKTLDTQGVTGIYYDSLQMRPEMNRVVITTNKEIMHWVGRVYRNSDVGAIFEKLFESEHPAIQSFHDHQWRFGSLTVSPEPVYTHHDTERAYAWLNSTGIYHGKLLNSPLGPELGNKVFSASTLIPHSAINSSDNCISSIALTKYHILLLRASSILAVNRIDGSIVFESILEQDAKVLSLHADTAKATFWVFTTNNIFEIVVTGEDRDLWKVMLTKDSFDEAMQFAKTPAQKDEVAIAHGDYLLTLGKYNDAAAVYGKSSKSFEEVTITFIEYGESDALRVYLLAKFQSLKKSSVMQRAMVASWLVDIFMSRLNTLEDMLSTVSTSTRESATSMEDISADMWSLKEDYHAFVQKHKLDLDRHTTYGIISSHGREEELLFYASNINDFGYVIAYWAQKGKWLEALNVLKKQSAPEMFYNYASVLMTNSPRETVDILMRQDYLNPRNLIPALLNYNRFTTVPLCQNQAVRYLNYVIMEQGSTDIAIHHTLIGIYATTTSSDESLLLRYLEKHTVDSRYDADFALRLCIQHGHVQSCVHIYSSMGQYAQAVELALKHGNVELASVAADRPESDPTLRKKLWLAIAHKVITRPKGIKEAIEFLYRCEILKIEDLIPLFPEFILINDFKDEVCMALDEYNQQIELLKKEMDESAHTADHIRNEISTLNHRYMIIEPGECCYICQYPLLSRQFFVFPCQHAFHGDCLTTQVMEQSGVGRFRKIKGLQRDVQQDYLRGEQGNFVAELDELIASEW